MIPRLPPPRSVRVDPDETPATYASQEDRWSVRPRPAAAFDPPKVERDGLSCYYVSQRDSDGRLIDEAIVYVASGVNNTPGLPYVIACETCVPTWTGRSTDCIHAEAIRLRLRLIHDR